MLDYLTLGDTPIHLDSASSKRIARGVSGLEALAAPRHTTRPRPSAHGAIDTTRYTDGQLVVIDGECAGDDEVEAFSEWDEVKAALLATLPDGLELKWRRGADGPELQRIVKLSALADPPMESVGSQLLYQAQLHSADPRAYSQTEQEVEGDGLTSGGGGLTFPQWTRRNLMPWSPSFESELLWTPRQSSGIDLDNTEFVVGASSVVVSTEGSPSVDDGLESPLCPVTPSNNYTLSAYVKAPSAVAIRMVLNETDGSGGVLGSSSVTEQGIDDWVRMSVTHAFGANAEAASVVFHPGSGDPPHEFNVDAVLLEKGSTLGSYFDGSTSALHRWTGHREFSISELITPNPTFPFTFTSSDGGEVVCVNGGARGTLAVIAIHGYATSPALVLMESGERVQLSGEVSAGDYLEIDFLERTILLNGTTDRRNLLDNRASDFFELPPGESTVRFVASNFDANAHAVIRFRDAY